MGRGDTRRDAAGADVAYQGALLTSPWHDFSDFLLRVNSVVSRIGYFADDVADTSLALTAKPKHVIQLCFYADLAGLMRKLLFQVAAPVRKLVLRIQSPHPLENDIEQRVGHLNAAVAQLMLRFHSARSRRSSQSYRRADRVTSTAFIAIGTMPRGAVVPTGNAARKPAPTGKPGANKADRGPGDMQIVVKAMARWTRQICPARATRGRSGRCQNAGWAGNYFREATMYST